jgi:hypothetical protein
MGILAALHALPPNTPAEIASDSLSTIQVLEKKEKLSTCKRLKMGARPIIISILRLLVLRRSLGTTTTYRHVKAHTEQTDFWSLGNALADRLADEAAEDPESISAQDTAFLTNEERIVAYVKHTKSATYTHVIGNLRACVRSQLIEQMVAATRTFSTQGRIMHKNPTQVRSIFRRLRRSHDATLFTFFLRAIARWLPTATVLSRGGVRTSEAIRCVLCAAKEATPDHALRCPAIASHIKLNHSNIPALVTALVKPLLDAPSLSSERKRHLSLLPETLGWYNPLEPFRPDAFHGYGWEPGALRDTLKKIDEADRYSSMLGIIPPALKTLLSPSMTECGFGEATHGARRKQQEDSWNNLQHALVSSSYIIFNIWKSALRTYHRVNKFPVHESTPGFAR